MGCRSWHLCHTGCTITTDIHYGRHNPMLATSEGSQGKRLRPEPWDIMVAWSAWCPTHFAATSHDYLQWCMPAAYLVSHDASPSYVRTHPVPAIQLSVHQCRINPREQTILSQEGTFEGMLLCCLQLGAQAEMA